MRLISDSHLTVVKMCRHWHSKLNSEEPDSFFVLKRERISIADQAVLSFVSAPRWQADRVYRSSGDIDYEILSAVVQGTVSRFSNHNPLQDVEG